MSHEEIIKKEKIYFELVTRLGSEMLENGGEIFRTGDVMTYAAHALGLKDFNTFVIANGIFASMLTDSQMYSCRVRYISLSPINICRLEALNTLSNNINNAKLLDLWHLALASNEQIKNMWVHGDVAPGNLLIKNGHLCAVIDFGILGVGDPACDYAMAWTFFNSQGREVFLKGLSQAMRNRAMGWALWKALITYESDEEERRVQARYTIAQIEKDYD